MVVTTVVMVVYDVYFIFYGDHRDQHVLTRSCPTRRRSDLDADEQAARCSQCGVPYCSVHCPLHNHIPDWLRLTAEGRLREAYELSNATSTMPEICGRICPQDRLCEGNCVIEFSGHGEVTIGSVEKYINDNVWAEGWGEPDRKRVGEGKGG